MSRYYNKEGDSISQKEWTELISRRTIYSLLKSSFLENGTTVHTFWTGVAYDYDGTGPLIFKTLVTDESLEEERYQYSTKEDALRHHKALCDSEATYLGNESPNRWQQICWEINNKNGKTHD